jgi:hypothetical protein
MSGAKVRRPMVAVELSSARTMARITAATTQDTRAPTAAVDDPPRRRATAQASAVGTPHHTERTRASLAIGLTDLPLIRRERAVPRGRLLRRVGQLAVSYANHRHPDPWPLGVVPP